MEIRAFQEALRLHTDLGWCILPIPHYSSEPIFDWTQYRTKLPTRQTLEHWLNMDTGIGVVCGEVSDNLIALEFSSLKFYNAWAAEYFASAPDYPTIREGEKVLVFCRTHEPIRSGALYMIGCHGKIGQVISDDRIVVLPATRSNLNNYIREWIVEAPDLLSESSLFMQEPAFRDRNPVYRRRLEELGLYSKAHPIAPRQRGHYEAKNAEKRWDECHLDPETIDKVFQPANRYLEPSPENEMYWIVEGFLPETYLAILAGASKCGKSCFLTALAMAVATGEPFLDLPTAKAPVLWVAYEESQEERALALRPFGKTPENLYITHDKILIDNDQGLATLRYWLRLTGAKLIILDPLYAAVGSQSLSDGQCARTALSGLKELCRQEKVAAIALHHLNKDTSGGMTRERIAESNQLLAVASMDMLMESSDRAGHREVRLRCRGRGSFANQSWVLMSEGPTDFQVVARGSDRALSVDPSELVMRPLRSASEPLSAEDLADLTGMHLKTLRNRMTQLLREGLVEVVGKEAKTVLYRAVRD